MKEKDVYLWLWDGPFGNGYEWFEKKIIKYELNDYNSLQKTGLSPEELYNVLESMCKRISKDISLDVYTNVIDYLPNNY